VGIARSLKAAVSALKIASAGPTPVAGKPNARIRLDRAESLGRKVSDEFTVPLCRDHHRELHLQGNERGWWANVQIAPLRVAKELWETTLLQVHRAHRQTNSSRDPEIGAAK
jgi:hypothetical protein